MQNLVFLLLSNINKTEIYIHIYIHLLFMILIHMNLLIFEFYFITFIYVLLQKQIFINTYLLKYTKLNYLNYHYTYFLLRVMLI